MNTAQIGIRELDSRSNDDIHVTLLWDPQADRVFLTLVDRRLHQAFEIDVDPADALDAFRHPYAYAAIGIERSMLAA